jgi:hypothetical protein
VGQRPDQSIILSYQECKFCGSSDGFVFYDSHGYCYHCNEVWFGQDYDKALEDMHKMHWTFRDDKTRVPQPDEYFGFVYIITNKKTQRKYIGCKQYWQMRHRKRYKPSNWKVYTSSSKELCEDIDKIGKRNFKFEIIQEYTTKRGLHYYEQYYQMKYHVLTAVLEGTDQKEYYNKNVGGIRFYCPLEIYEDPEYKKKKSAAAKAQWADPNSGYRTTEKMWKDPDYKEDQSKKMKKQWKDPKWKKKRMKYLETGEKGGPYRITFDTGESIIVPNNISKWAKSNGYNQGCLSALLTGKAYLDKRYGKAYKATKHKDIVKVERVGEQTSDMG